MGGVHKIQILIRDLLKDFFTKIFGEDFGGVRGHCDPLMIYSMSRPLVLTVETTNPNS